MAEEKKKQQKSGKVSRNNSLCQHYEHNATAHNFTPPTYRHNGIKDVSRQPYQAQNAAIPAAAAQNYTWSDRVQSLRDFVSKTKLPAIARILNSAGDLPQELLSPTTSQQPQRPSGPTGPSVGHTQSQQGSAVVRIHEVGKRRVVLARRVQWEKRQNDYVASGEQVDIPAPFKGWFEAAPEDGRTVEYCDTVGAVCGDKPRQFLVRSPTVAYRLSGEGEEGGQSCWLPHEIPSGEVLNTGTVYDHMPNVRSSNSRTSRAADGGKRGKRSRSVSPGRGFLRRLLKPSRSKPKTEQEYKYLQCFDSNGQEITIPLATTGIFSPVGDPTLASYDAVYQLQDLILAFGLPVNAQLIHSSPGEKNVCPQGVLRLYGTREEEMAVISRLDPGQGDHGTDIPQPPEKVEVSLDRSLQLQLGKPVSEKDKQQTVPASNTCAKTDESAVHAVGERREEPVQIELPKCVSKELKKFKSTGILDKLRVRAMRKERSKGRENASSNSKQVAHHDLCYEDFFNGLDKPVTQKEINVQSDKTFDGKSDPSEKAQKGPLQDSPHESSGSNDTHSSTNGPRRLSLQQIRDLPPIPRRTLLTPPTQQGGSSKGSKDSLYDHLPPAPTPPHQRSNSDPVHSDHNNDYNHLDDTHHNDDDDDGYMVPSDIPGADSASPVNAAPPVQYRSPAVSQRSGKTSRLKKCHSELFAADLHSGVLATDDGWHLDIDQLFSSTYSKKSQSLYGPVTTTAWTGSTSQLYDVNAKKAQASEAVTAWRADVERYQDKHRPTSLAAGSLGRQSAEKLNLETPATTGRRSGKRTPSHRINTTATLRSHNLRQPKASLMELFQFSDSFQDEADQNAASSPTTSLPLGSASSTVQSSFNQSPFPAMSVARINERRRRDSSYGEMVTSPSTSLLNSKGAAPDYRYRNSQLTTYAESEPFFHTMYPHTPSLSALSDPAYPKYGDDSAISVGSRDRENPYGFTNGSDLSFHYDNGSGGTLISVEACWSPPDDISGLSVQEVSRSLRYIGMKDRVVLRFANEQIDGNMLSSLDKRLLKEGFPELNALEIKKILDFVHGWRPKKK